MGFRELRFVLVRPLPPGPAYRFQLGDAVRGQRNVLPGDGYTAVRRAQHVQVCKDREVKKFKDKRDLDYVTTGIIYCDNFSWL